MACLDTVVLIDLMQGGTRENGRRALAKVAEECRAGRPLCTTRLNVAELYLGIEKSREPALEAARVARILADIPVLEFDDHAARWFARITAELERAGRPSGDMDVLIAAVAAANGQSLMTRNVRHFEHMPGVAIVGY
jgi:tRNA(fMet)-specific endonuclease VapC